MVSEMKKNILESLIHRELLYQEAEKSGIKIEAAAIDEQFGNWKKQIPDEAQFRDVMKKMNLSEEIIKSNIRQRMLVQQFIDKQFGEKLTVSDEEIKTYYDAHPELFKESEKVRASHILIKTDPKGDEPKKAEALKKLGEIQQKLKKGEDFAELAKASSECPSKKKAETSAISGMDRWSNHLKTLLLP